MKLLQNHPFRPALLMAKRIFQRFAPHEKYIVGLFMLVAIISLIALGMQFYINKTETAPANGGEYREAVVGLPRFINPALAITNDVDRDLTHLIYSSLMGYSANGELVPDLAESYEVSENGRTYKFILKENLKWEDGTPLTAEDVLFTIELIQDPQYSSPLFQSWQGVVVAAEDERTVTFTLPSAYPPFLENTTVGIMPKHVWQDITPKNFALTDLNIQPIGSGKFQVEKFAKDNSGFISFYTLKRNENYHGKKTYINKLTLKFYDSEEDAIKAYNSKSVDGIAFISPTSIERLRDKRSLEVHTFDMPRYFAIFINQEKNEFLKEDSIREALAYATNNQEVIDEVLDGYGVISNTPIPPTLSGYYNEDIEDPHYNLDEARAILEREGWTIINEDGIREKQIAEGEEGEEDTNARLSFTLITANRPELVAVAELVAKQWADVGVELNIETRELGELQQDVIKSRSYELLMFGQVLGAIPDPFSFWHSNQRSDPGLNLSNYSNENVDKLLQDGRQELDKEKRIEIYKDLQEALVADVPAIFLYEPAYLYPVHNRIQGIEGRFIVDTSYRFSNIENWYIDTKRVFKN